VAAWVPDIFGIFYFLKNHKIAKNSTTKAHEKITTETLEFYNILIYIWLNLKEIYFYFLKLATVTDNQVIYWVKHRHQLKIFIIINNHNVWPLMSLLTLTTLVLKLWSYLSYTFTPALSLSLSLFLFVWVCGWVYNCSGIERKTERDYVYWRVTYDDIRYKMK
jgi:hypothetical protein